MAAGASRARLAASRAPCPAPCPAPRPRACPPFHLAHPCPVRPSPVARLRSSRPRRTVRPRQIASFPFRPAGPCRAASCPGPLAFRLGPCRLPCPSPDGACIPTVACPPARPDVCRLLLEFLLVTADRAALVLVGSLLLAASALPQWAAVRLRSADWPSPRGRQASRSGRPVASALRATWPRPCPGRGSRRPSSTRSRQASSLPRRPWPSPARSGSSGRTNSGRTCPGRTCPGRARRLRLRWWRDRHEVRARLLDLVACPGGLLVRVEVH